jgi:hypothetical protein
MFAGRTPVTLGWGVAVALALISTPASAQVATLYVDGTLRTDCPGTYDVATRNCGGGAAHAYASLSRAATTALPGNTVSIRGGVYQEILAPARSGAPGQPITFRAHGAEPVQLSSPSGIALNLVSRSHITVEGLAISNASGWGRLENSIGVVIRNNRFAQATATGTTGGLKLVRSSLNQIIGNTFEDGNDSLVIQESDRNLVLGNMFSKARHSLLSIRCSSYNVVRENRFHNLDQKAAEIYDCEGVSDAPVRLDATKRNLIDGNIFAGTPPADAEHRYNGIQLAGQQGIIRRNLFYDNLGGGINFSVYSDEALHNYGNRVYNNTFYANHCYGLAASDDVDPARYFGNRVENNLFYRNTDCGGSAAQINIRNSTAVALANNAILTVSPLFVDESTRDLRLTAASPMVDAAAFVTRAAAAGSGTQLRVTDAGYFFDGFGVSGQEGDEVQLDSETSQTARIVAIDYVNNLLTLKTPLSWSAGQAIHLAYTGRRPDMGARELTTSGLPAAPTNLVVH